MKTVLVLQAFGMGDCIWAQSIAHHFIDQGYSVVWPVKSPFYHQLIKAYPKIHWVPDSIVKSELFLIKEKIEVEGMLIAPIRWSDSYMKLPYKDVMIAKYLMYELDWNIWREHAMWERNINKERMLMKELGLLDGVPYCLVNKRFGSNPVREVEIKPGMAYKQVEMREVPGYSLFDWTMTILNASEIHTVSTSLLFCLEMLPLNCPIHIYTRKPIEGDLDFVRPLFTKPYITHE